MEMGVDVAGDGLGDAGGGFQVMQPGLLDAAGGAEVVQQGAFAAGADAGNFVEFAGDQGFGAAGAVGAVAGSGRLPVCAGIGDV